MNSASLGERGDDLIRATVDDLHAVHLVDFLLLTGLPKLNDWSIDFVRPEGRLIPVSVDKLLPDLQLLQFSLIEKRLIEVTEIECFEVPRNLARPPELLEEIDNVLLAAVLVPDHVIQTSLIFLGKLLVEEGIFTTLLVDLMENGCRVLESVYLSFP